MTSEQKELLLKDLCARLPYKTAVSVCGIPFHWDYKKFMDNPRHFNSYLNDILRGDVKPYLFPMSSMTEEQKYDFYCRFIENDCDFNDFKEFYLDYGMWHKLLTSLDDIEAIIDWFHKNYFDYRGLIPKGLAIDATGKNIY